MQRRTVLKALGWSGLAGPALIGDRAVAAEAFPMRPITVVVPFTAGANSDVAAASSPPSCSGSSASSAS